MAVGKLMIPAFVHPGSFYAGDCVPCSKKKRLYLKLSAFLSLLGFLLVAFQISKANAISLSQKRLVFQGPVTTQEFTLINDGSDRTTFRFSLVNRQVDEDGIQTELKESKPEDQTAEKLVRLSLRQATLAPGQSQAFRIALRVPPDLADGEYRTHLLIEGIPETPPRTEQPDTKAGSFNITVASNYAVTLPILVRRGALTASVTVAEIKLHPATPEKKTDRMEVVMERTGSRSVYGSVGLFAINPDGTEKPIAGLQGVAIYATQPRRRVMINLKPSDLAVLQASQVKVIFQEQDPTVKETVKAEKPL